MTKGRMTKKAGGGGGGWTGGLGGVEGAFFTWQRARSTRQLQVANAGLGSNSDTRNRKGAVIEFRRRQMRRKQSMTNELLS